MIQKIKRVIENSTLLSILSVIGFLVGIISLIATFVFSGGVKPMYSISSPVEIAKISDEAPRLQLLWDGKEIENVYLTEVVIWNNGRKEIRRDDISEDNPIQVRYSKDVKILSASFSKVSRDNLKLDAIVEENSIHIDIVGDEALESEDGGVLSILYVGSEDSIFTVDGRIFGYKDGFSKYPYDTIYTNSIPGRILSGLGAIFFFIYAYRVTLEYVKFMRKEDSEVTSHLSGILPITISFLFGCSLFHAALLSPNLQWIWIK